MRETVRTYELDFMRDCLQQSIKSMLEEVEMIESDIGKEKRRYAARALDNWIKHLGEIATNPFHQYHYNSGPPFGRLLTDEFSPTPKQREKFYEARSQASHDHEKQSVLAGIVDSNLGRRYVSGS